MEYAGTFRHGVVVLDDNPSIEDGTRVRILVVGNDPQPTLAELFKDLAGKAVGLPADMTWRRSSCR